MPRLVGALAACLELAVRSARGMPRRTAEIVSAGTCWCQPVRAGVIPYVLVSTLTCWCQPLRAGVSPHVLVSARTCWYQPVRAASSRARSTTASPPRVSIRPPRRATLTMWPRRIFLYAQPTTTSPQQRLWQQRVKRAHTVQHSGMIRCPHHQRRARRESTALWPRGSTKPGFNLRLPRKLTARRAAGDRHAQAREQPKDCQPRRLSRGPLLAPR